MERVTKFISTLISGGYFILKYTQKTVLHRNDHYLELLPVNQTEYLIHSS